MSLRRFQKLVPTKKESHLSWLLLAFFFSTVDSLKELPFVIANTVLSILSVDYPVDKASCYVLDDGSSMLTFEALSETSEFARKWVLFCKKYGYLALDRIDFKWPWPSALSSFHANKDGSDWLQKRQGNVLNPRCHPSRRSAMATEFVEEPLAVAWVLTITPCCEVACRGLCCYI